MYEYAVLGVLYDLAPEDNPDLAPLLASALNGSTFWISLMAWLPQDRDEYYRYLGSLTAPPCTPNVIWTVMKDTQRISQAQLATLRQLSEIHPDLGNNFRPRVAAEKRRVSDTMSLWVFNGGHVIIASEMATIAAVVAAFLWPRR